MVPTLAPQFATQRRARLFESLVELLLADGFAHLTVDDIAAQLRCSKSTLYTLAGSKEQLVQAATVYFFRRATDEVEAAVAATAPADRLTTYLSAVGDALVTASDQFMTDLASFAPSREVYEKNTRLAAERVQQLIVEGVAAGTFSAVDASFAADLAATMMVRIQQGGVRLSTGLDDAQAYSELSRFMKRALSRP